MLKLEKTEGSTSPWHSLQVLVPKPDRFVQFCIDFRKLDNMPTFNVYLIPQVDALLDVMGGPKCCLQ